MRGLLGRASAVVATALLTTLSTAAVEPGQPSKTSVWVLAARAIGARDPDPTVRNPDWIAEQLIGPDERALIAGHPVIEGLDKDYRVAMQEPETKARVLMMNIRTRYIDQRLLEAVAAGAGQVVILGAGFDSRVYRFRQALRGARVFEVDFGPTQEYKRRRALAVLGPPPPNLTYVAVDFTRQRVGDVLRRAGHRRDRRTFFIWEGVSMYLTEENVKAFLRDVASVAGPESSIVFDHFNPFFDPPPNETIAALVSQLKAWGEPWVSGIPFGQERSFLESVGWRLDEHVSMLVTSDDAKRYLVRQDGTVVGDVQFPPAGTPQRTVHWMATAGVMPRTTSGR